MSITWSAHSLCQYRMSYCARIGSGVETCETIWSCASPRLAPPSTSVFNLLSSLFTSPRLCDETHDHHILCSPSLLPLLYLSLCFSCSLSFCLFLLLALSSFAWKQLRMDHFWHPKIVNYSSIYKLSFMSFKANVDVQWFFLITR